MKFVIFIGQHKVGSTSLQNYMGLNYDRLLKRGILYPNVQNPDLTLRSKLWFARKLGIGPVPLIVREGHNALAQSLIARAKGYELPPWFKDAPSAQEMIGTIRDEIGRHQPDTVFLCSEAFSNFSENAPGAIEAVADICGNHPVKILATLRRPDEYIVSWHLQRLKFGDKINPLREGGLEEYFGTFHLDYQHMMSPWLKTFPNAEYSLVNYSDVLDDGGSIPSFWRQIGVSEPTNFKSVARGNPSIHPAISEIIRRANHSLPPDKGQKFWRWMVASSKKFDLPTAKSVEVLGQDARRAIASSFAGSHEFLAARFGPDPFFPGFEQIENCLPIPEAEAFAQALPKVQQTVQSSSLDSEIKNFVSGFVHS